MAIPSRSGAIHRRAKLRKTERSGLAQSSPRPALERRPAEAPGTSASQAANPSENAGQSFTGAGGAQAPLDVEAALGSFLDELAAETVRLSNAQRRSGRGRMSAWRRSLSALAQRLWRLESKIVRAAFHVG